MTNKNKELPKGLVEEVARAICYHNDPLKTDDYRNWIVEAEASLSVIAPHYEKQIAELKTLVAWYETPKPANEYHEDDGNVLWWKLPVSEPPYCGSSNDYDFSENYYTHFTSIVRNSVLREWGNLPKPPAE